MGSRGVMMTVLWLYAGSPWRDRGRDALRPSRGRLRSRRRAQTAAGSTRRGARLHSWGGESLVLPKRRHSTPWHWLFFGRHSSSFSSARAKILHAGRPCSDIRPDTNRCLPEAGRGTSGGKTPGYPRRPWSGGPRRGFSALARLETGQRQEGLVQSRPATRPQATSPRVAASTLPADGSADRPLDDALGLVGAVDPGAGGELKVVAEVGVLVRDAVDRPPDAVVNGFA